MEVTTAGNPAISAITRMRRSWTRRGLLNFTACSHSVALQAAVQSAAAEAQSIGGVAHVSIVARERFLDEEGLHFLDAHVFQARAAFASRAQRQIDGLDLAVLGHEH